jgi:hypothetical protein
MSLYADYHPETSTKGFGYGNKKKAVETLKKLKKMKSNRTYTLQVVNTMYNRAKYHKNRTKDMEDAMKVYEKFLKKYNKKNSNKNSKKKISKKRKVSGKKVSKNVS